MIPVTKPYLPDRKKLARYIDGIYDRHWLTNNGQLLQRLTERLEDYLGVKHLLLVSNGTLALQIAYRALGINEAVDNAPAQAITTPFTFVATASSLKWEGIEIVFADIDPKTWCLAPEKILSKITSKTRAIVPVHVFGNACDVKFIDRLAAKHNLKVIYDGSHAFGAKYHGKSLLNFGDATTLSFHATKLFHTCEGGAVIFKHEEDFNRAKMMINFGITGPESIDSLGINAKMNELQAAMGLCVLDEMDENLKARERVWCRYQQALPQSLQLQEIHEDLDYNYAYFPVVFDSEAQVLSISRILEENSVFTRRYFYPSLDTVECLGQYALQPISNQIASRVLCLPIYADLPIESVDMIARIIGEALS
ncbi:MAG: DegT/DnrJ/EryC1/StrS family aminotransferase [Oceanospirillaceae bacterium]|nr:DegT/DnrJ/EryC1/StrS family aminotransferase [Oceanospirillaceae bacterium]